MLTTKEMSWLRNIRQWSGQGTVKALIEAVRNGKQMENVVVNRQ